MESNNELEGKIMLERLGHTQLVNILWGVHTDLKQGVAPGKIDILGQAREALNAQGRQQNGQDNKNDSMSKDDPEKCKLFVRDLAWATTSDNLKKIFGGFGPIVEAVVVRDRNTGKSKGYGFVTFFKAAHADAALSNPRIDIDGRMAQVNLASQGRSGRPGMGGRPGGMSGGGMNRGNGGGSGWQTQHVSPIGRYPAPRGGYGMSQGWGGYQGGARVDGGAQSQHRPLFDPISQAGGAHVNPSQASPYGQQQQQQQPYYGSAPGYYGGAHSSSMYQPPAGGAQAYSAPLQGYNAPPSTQQQQQQQQF